MSNLASSDPQGHLQAMADAELSPAEQGETPRTDAEYERADTLSRETGGEYSVSEALYAFACTLECELTDLRAKLAAAEKDAERWRHAEKNVSYSFDSADRTYYWRVKGRQEFSDHIDAAIEKERSRG